MEDNINIKDNDRIYTIVDITDNSTADICYSILCINEYDRLKTMEDESYRREPINLYINSKGGEMNGAWALIDIISESKTPIHTYVMGCAYSAAALILLSGHKRYMYKHSLLGIHSIFFEFSNYQISTLKQFENDIDHFQIYLNRMIDFLNCNTDMDPEFINNILNNDQMTYMCPNDALKYGCIDKII